MRKARKYKAAKMDEINVDYRRVVSMPIHDMWQDGKIIFLVDIYGVEPNDLAVMPGGSRPMHKAIERLGLNTDRYQAWLWDIGIRGERQ